MSYNLENIDILPDDVEKEIIKKINKEAPDCYAKLTNNDINIFEKEIILNPLYKKYNISLEQINSIRSAYIKNKMIKTHFRLIKNTEKIVKDYQNNIPVLELSKKYDASPLNIMRFVLLKNHSKEKVKKMFNEPKLLNDYDYEQFTIAKNNDDFALVNQNDILEKANLFEKQIEEILKINNIKYKTQDDLVKEQIKLYGKPINTPDFLIETNLKINNRFIKWIDAKNFYGSNINFVKSKINNQTKKYINDYGDGCIVFNLGFNQTFTDNSNILFLSWNTFNKLS